MSEENKLTDEEIVKAMEICANWNSMSNCKDCPIGLDVCCENQNGFAKHALNLIHRLQEEIERLTEDCESADAVLEAQGHLIDLIKKDKVELQKQVEYWESETKIARRDIDEAERLRKIQQERGDALYKQVMEGIQDYEKLQKQVDELKESAKLDLKREKKWGKLMKEQAVKDTAKEILLWLLENTVGTCDFEALFKERYGVEVE